MERKKREERKKRIAGFEWPASEELRKEMEFRKSMKRFRKSMKDFLTKVALALEREANDIVGTIHNWKA